jgi:hypothetical protein
MLTVATLMLAVVPVARRQHRIPAVPPPAKQGISKLSTYERAEMMSEMPEESLKELVQSGAVCATCFGSVRGWMQAELSNAPAGEAALKVDEVNDVILQVAANRSEARTVRETPAQSR